MQIKPVLIHEHTVDQWYKCVSPLLRRISHGSGIPDKLLTICVFLFLPRSLPFRGTAIDTMAAKLVCHAPIVHAY